MSEYYCSHKPPCCPQLTITHDHLQKMQVTNGSLTQEIDKLKAELGELKGHFQWEMEQRDLWKSKAEKLAWMLRRAMLRLGPGEECDTFSSKVKDALKEYESK